MNDFRIKEAEKHSKEKVLKLKRSELTKLLKPHSSEDSKRHLSSNLFGDRIKFIHRSWIAKICTFYGVDANFLFNIKPMNSTSSNKVKIALEIDCDNRMDSIIEAEEIRIKIEREFDIKTKLIIS